MQLFVIYEHPPTHPQQCVLRHLELQGDGTVREIACHARESLTEVRQLVPDDTFCVHRRSGTPSVVEVWL